jgi:hypothetical protein
VRFAALRDPSLRRVAAELGTAKNATSEKAKRLLGWAPHSHEEAIAATGERLIRLGRLKDNARRVA